MIGSRLSTKLLDKGYSMVILDDFSSGLSINIDRRSKIIRGSIDDSKLLNDIFNQYRFKYIFHLAALFANQNSVDHPEKDLQINGMGTLRILEKANEAYKQGIMSRFFYASSSCIYGGMQKGSIAETNPKHLETPYAITKLLGEYYTTYYNEMYALPFTTFRFFNSYGPGELPGRYRNVIPNFIHKALKNDLISITGTGNETRDFTFIDDTVKGILLSMQSEKAIGKTYNIATGRETRIIDLAQKIIELTGSKSEIVFEPKRAWDKTSRRCGDISLIKNDLGYHAATSLEEGLGATINWLKEQLADTLIQK